MKDKSRDRELGMDRPITRRDFLNGVALTVGAGAAGLAAASTIAPSRQLTDGQPAGACRAARPQRGGDERHALDPRRRVLGDGAGARGDRRELRSRRGRRRHIGAGRGVPLPPAGRRAGENPDPREQRRFRRPCPPQRIHGVQRQDGPRLWRLAVAADAELLHAAGQQGARATSASSLPPSRTGTTPPGTKSAAWARRCSSRRRRSAPTRWCRRPKARPTGCPTRRSTTRPSAT